MAGVVLSVWWTRQKLLVREVERHGGDAVSTFLEKALVRGPGAKGGCSRDLSDSLPHGSDSLVGRARDCPTRSPSVEKPATHADPGRGRKQLHERGVAKKPRVI